MILRRPRQVFRWQNQNEACVNRVWSILFLLVPVGGIAAFIWAANGWSPFIGAWLPDNYSESGTAIDALYRLIHWICAVFFVAIGISISWFLWHFGNVDRGKASYFCSSVKLEILWSVLPAVILISLAIYQLQAWSAQRLDRPVIESNGDVVFKPPNVLVTGKQFGWEFKYTGRDDKFETPDDVTVENMMVVPDDEVIVMQLQSRDVIHSFFVPKLRLKHDLVPGMSHVAWFKPTSTATMNILCAELCGWGHYKMNAILKIVSRQEYDEWIKAQQKKNDPPELVPFSELP